MAVMSHSSATALINLLNISSILICFVSKLPQINTVIKTKSVGGISTFSLLLELCRLAILWAYNYCYGYSVFTYLEYPFLLIQQTILFHFVANYRNASTLQTTAITLSILSSVLLFLSGVLPKWILSYLLAMCPAMVIASRFTQLYQILREKQANNINVMTWAMTSYTGLARIITVLLSSVDKMLLLNFVTSFAGSASILASAIYYQKRSKKDN